MPTISGTVLDDTGAAVAGRTVRAYRRDTGALLAETLTSEGVTGDADFSSVSLLLHMNGSNGSTTFTDSSLSPKTITRFGDAQISTAQSKFGGASAYFDGTGDYLTAPNTATPAGTEAFTVEAWIRVPSFPGSGVKMLWQWLATNGVNLEITNTGAVGLYQHSPANYASGGQLVVNTWHHVALTRSGNNFAFWLDGTQAFTMTSTASYSAATFNLGYDTTTPSRAYLGYFDEVRITKGVARYTANFTPTDVPFPDTSLTLALGEYGITTSHTGECNVVCLDDAAGTVYNDLILRTTPV
jgi:hypothetical protein